MMDSNIQKIVKGEKVPQFDLPVNLIVYDDVNADLLKFYASFPCKIDAAIFCYVDKGYVKATINLWQYEIKEHDFVIIMPGSFMLIEDVSNDVHVSFEGFSSDFLKRINPWQILSPILFHVFERPVFPLGAEMGDIFKDIFSVMTRANALNPIFQTGNVAQDALALTVDILHNAIKIDGPSDNGPKPSTRDQEIVSRFLRTAFERYRTEHRVSYYAHDAGLTLSHFCNVIGKSIGMTPQEVIMNLIVMDAKTQLKRTTATSAKISRSLGFTTPTSFNRYFRKYTGMTPQDYRNS